MKKYTVIGANGSVYVRRLERYPAQGETLDLNEIEAAVLLSANLIEPFREDTQVQDLPAAVSIETPAVEDNIVIQPKNKRSMKWQN